MAQSSVEIYGYLDVGVAKMKGGQLGVNNTGYVTPPSQATTGLTNSFARSGLTTNFIGFRGTEDLGGGMKATFNVQTGGLDTSTGSPALRFDREANLGLSGGFGGIKIGRSVSTICAVGCSFDYNGIGNGDAHVLNGLSAASIKQSSRRGNQIEWTSPTMSGFTAKVATIMKGDAIEDSTFSAGVGASGPTFAGGVTTALNYKAVYALGLNYANGPIRLAYAHETAATDATAKRAAQFAAAEYDFRVAKANVTYTVNDTKGGNYAATANAAAGAFVGSTPLSSTAGQSAGKGFGAGLVVPMGALNVGMHYSDNTENKTQNTEVFARYSLSKRTEIYSYYGMTKGVVAKTATVHTTGAGTGGTATNTVATNINSLGVGAIPANPTVFGAGLRHSF
jgi:predicted porin